MAASRIGYDNREAVCLFSPSDHVSAFVPDSWSIENAVPNSEHYSLTSGAIPLPDSADPPLAEAQRSPDPCPVQVTWTQQVPHLSGEDRARCIQAVLQKISGGAPLLEAVGRPVRIRRSL